MVFRWSDYLPGSTPKSFTLDEIRKSKFGEYFDHLQQNLERYSSDNSLLLSANEILLVKFDHKDPQSFLEKILEKVPGFGFETRRLVMRSGDHQDEKKYSGFITTAEKDFEYLDSQMFSLLDNNPRVYISDTSKIHTLKFHSGKSIPKTVLGFALGDLDGWECVLWFANSEEVALTKEEADGLEMIRTAVSFSIKQAINMQKSILEVQLWKDTFIHFPFPCLIVSDSDLTEINPSAEKMIKSAGVKDVDEVKQLIQSAVDQEKSHLDLANRSYRLLSRKAKLEDGSQKLIVFMTDENQSTVQRQYLNNVMQAIALNIEAPMNNILGYAKMIPLLSKLEEPQQDYLDRVVEEAERCMSYSSVLMDLSRFDKSQPLLTSEITFNKIVVQLLEASQHLLRQKRVLVENKLENSDQVVIIDHELFNQGVYLVLEYMLGLLDPGKKITITNSQTGIEYIFCLADNGRGFSEVDLAVLNDPFAETSVDSRIRTAGGIMQLHGGSLAIKSELGKGSEYRFIWPSG